eukprot:g50056.t1
MATKRHQDDDIKTTPARPTKKAKQADEQKELEHRSLCIHLPLLLGLRLSLRLPKTRLEHRSLCLHLPLLLVEFQKRGSPHAAAGSKTELDAGTSQAGSKTRLEPMPDINQEEDGFFSTDVLGNGFGSCDELDLDLSKEVEVKHLKNENDALKLRIRKLQISKEVLDATAACLQDEMAQQSEFIAAAYQKGVAFGKQERWGKSFVEVLNEENDKHYKNGWKNALSQVRFTFNRTVRNMEIVEKMCNG